MMPHTSSTGTIRDASRTPRGMVVLIRITILFLVISACNVLSQYNDTTHTIVWSSIAVNHSSNSNLSESFTSDEIAPDLQQAKQESKSFRINDLNPTQVPAQEVMNLVSGETEAEAIQTDSTRHFFSMDKTYKPKKKIGNLYTLPRLPP